MREIKFNLITYKPIRVYSKTHNSYFKAKETAHIDRLDPNTPAPAENLDIEEILKRLPKGVEKSKRSCVQLFDIDTFALKEFVSMDKWNGCIFIDLDIYKANVLKDKPDVEARLNVLYDEVVKSLSENTECFYYAERSSSGGFHFLFNYDVEPTQENFDKCAQYTKRLVYEAGDIFTEWHEILDDEGVVDPIYTRPYQRVYITGIDAVLNYNHTGEISADELSKIKVRDRQAQRLANAGKTYELVNFSPEGEYETDHNKRFYIYTALKRVTPNKATCNAYYEKLCEHFKTYKSYTIQSFKTEFDYDQIDESTAYVPILKKYGIKIDTNILHYHLRDNEYMSNVIDDILGQMDYGINMLLAPTGVGKNQTWINYNKQMLADPLSVNSKPILIIEPLNSIIETKYDDSVCVITGSKQFPEAIAGYGMYVTNYNKVLRRTPDTGWTLKENLAKWFGQFEMVIIDESHIIIKDSFRCDVLTEFVKTIREASKFTKIVLQTATPMDEELLFDINKKFILYKEPKRKSKFIFRRFSPDKPERFKIQEVVCLCRYYIERGRKVYIYWSNASLQTLESFKATYETPGRVAIFHKRNTGDNDMDYIAKEHELGDKFDILLTSVYFGVGNDLNDETNAAVIIIGNNTWQEDMQVIGRWRNSPNVEVCEIIKDDNDFDFVESTANVTGNRYTELKKWYNLYLNVWNDKRRREKSVVINKKGCVLKTVDDIYTLAVMKSSEIYHSGFNVKVEKLSDPYYNIRMKTDYKRILECNAEYIEAVRAFNRSVKNVRDKQKAKIMEGTPDWEVIHRDTKLDKFSRLWSKMKLYGVDKILPANEIARNANYNMLDLWARYYKTILVEKTDCPEIYALLWFRDRLHHKTDDEIDAMSANVGTYVDGEDEYEMTELEQYFIYAYIIWLVYRNKNEDTRPIQGNYYNTLKYNCKLFLRLPDVLVEKIEEHLEDINPRKVQPYTETNEFFNEEYIENDGKEEIKKWIDIKKIISCVETNVKENAHKLIVKCLKNKKCAGRPAGSDKPVTIKGVTYKNSKEAQSVLGKSAAWVSKYKDK